MLLVLAVGSVNSVWHMDGHFDAGEVGERVSMREGVGGVGGGGG